LQIYAAGPDAMISPRNHGRLAIWSGRMNSGTHPNYFYQSLQTELSKNFTLMNQPGPGVLKLRVALMDATTATLGLRSISMIVPQARLLNGLQSLATGSYAFVGSAEAEMIAGD